MALSKHTRDLPAFVTAGYNLVVQALQIQVHAAVFQPHDPPAHLPLALAGSKARLTRQIRRVNHAGEHGAIAIYRAQIAHVGKKQPDLARWLGETLAMADRSVTPCGALAVWSIGGAVLGRSMALFGPYGVMICTAAVERTVHRHLQQQVDFLSGYDDALAKLIGEILKEENEHLLYAETRHDPNCVLARLLSAFVTSATALLILASTQGGSSA